MTQPPATPQEPVRDDPIARLLDPLDRFVALHHDLPALRADLGPHCTTQVECMLHDVLCLLASEYQDHLAQLTDYGDYLLLLREAALESERLFRSDLRLWRDLKLDEATMQRITRLLKFQLVAHLETTL